MGEVEGQDNRGKRLLDPKVVEVMVREGYTRKEIAESCGVTLGAVSAHINRKKKQTTKYLVETTVRPVVRRELNAVDQLGKINDHANLLLDKAMEGLQGVEKIEDFKDAEAAMYVAKLVVEAKDVALKAMGEIRHQLKLQLDIFNSLFDARAVQEFQEELMTVLGEVDASVRDEFLRRIRQKRAVRQTIQAG